ncbi:MAG: polymer-forming cytoskeletal protein [Pyrinomonadaceae bacterium]|nr:polymer-forming cytoskeletal protein [Pyrinomonadaceae bacterium]MBP6214084.1 polymer-forming cytoskeletal protein [Pyrinomonadaceae bacterium]
MNYSFRTIISDKLSVRAIAYAIWLACLVFALTLTAQARPEITLSDDEKTLIVEDAPEMEVLAIAKSVEVRKSAKGVFSFGGDVIVSGRVEGDVATIGGSVIQKESGYIGGDVIVFGGSYKHESQTALREPGKETVVFGVWEDELRDLAQNPSQILSPTMSWTFLAQRLLLALFWFAVSMVLMTIAPGAVGRAVARIQLSTLTVSSLGSVAFIGAMIAIVGSLSVLPDFLSATLGLMGLLILLLAYVFGRVALQVTVGKIIQKQFLSEINRSETLGTLLGVLVWTLLLSIPYIWIIALFSVFAVGIGLILTARSSNVWQKA